MPGTPQTLPVPPPVSILTMLNAIRLAAGPGGSGGAAWGSITGTLSAQTDLQTALDARLLLSGGTMTGDLTTKAAGLLIPGAVSGVATIQAPPVAGTPTITLPSVTATLATLGANGFTGAQILSANGAASAPVLSLTGSVFTGGSATTTKPLFLLEPSGTASTNWSTAGTVLGINAVSGFAGDLINLQVAAIDRFKVDLNGVFRFNKIGADSTLGVLTSIYGTTSIKTDGAASFLVDKNIGALSGGDVLVFSDSGKLRFGLSNDVVFARKAAATIQMGIDAAGVTNQMFTAASRITSDGVGANLTIAGGNGRGGAGGSLILSTYDTGAAATIGTLRSRLVIDTAGAISFPVTTAVTTETVVSDTTWPITINGVAYKVCLKA